MIKSRKDNLRHDNISYLIIFCMCRQIINICMSLLCSCFHILHAKYRQLAGCLRCTFYYSYGLSERHLKWTNISCLVHLLINFISLDTGNITDVWYTWYQQSKVSASSSSVRPLYFPTCSRENGITLHFNYASNPFVWHSVRCKICIQILLVLRPPILQSYQK